MGILRGASRITPVISSAPAITRKPHFPLQVSTTTPGDTLSPSLRACLDSRLGSRHRRELSLLNGQILSLDDIHSITNIERLQDLYTEIIRLEQHSFLHASERTGRFKTLIRSQILARLEEDKRTSPEPRRGRSPHGFYISLVGLHRYTHFQLYGSKLQSWNETVASDSRVRRYYGPWQQLGKTFIAQPKPGKKSNRPARRRVPAWDACMIPLISKRRTDNDSATAVSTDDHTDPSQGAGLGGSHLADIASEVIRKRRSRITVAHTMNDIPQIREAIVKGLAASSSVGAVDTVFYNTGRLGIDYPTKEVKSGRDYTTEAESISSSSIVTLAADKSIEETTLFARMRRPWLLVSDIVRLQLMTPQGPRIARAAGVPAMLDAHHSLPDTFATPPDDGMGLCERTWVRSTGPGTTEVDLAPLIASAAEVYALQGYQPSDVCPPSQPTYTPKAPPVSVQVPSYFSPETVHPPLPPQTELPNVVRPSLQSNLCPPRKWIGADISQLDVGLGGIFNRVMKTDLLSCSFPLALPWEVQDGKIEISEYELERFETALQKTRIPAAAMIPRALRSSPIAKTLRLRENALSLTLCQARYARRLGLSMLQLPIPTISGSLTTTAQGCSLMAEFINIIHRQVPGITIVLPSTVDVYTSACLLKRFEHYRAIIADIKDKTRIGVCLSTSALISAGYDITTEEKFHDTMLAFDRIVGRHYLVGMRFSDTLSGVGEWRRVRTHIGAGICDPEIFKYILRSDWFDYMPLLYDVKPIIDTAEWESVIGPTLWRAAAVEAEKQLKVQGNIYDW